jgi:3-hydroxyisobutyrate dehydrogenase-like beta-hydroxyacid dehydrogenase
MPQGKTDVQSAGTSEAARGSQITPGAEIGFIGLGHMGKPMAANLAAAGHKVRAYVRRPDQMERLAALGIEPTTDISRLFDRDIVITMVPDDAALRDIVLGRQDLGTKGLVAGLNPGAIHLSMSTVGPSTAQELAKKHAAEGQRYVAAPLFGNPAAAEARQLFVIAAGASDDIERCQPLFEALGQRTFRVDTEPGHANLVKLLGNMMTATALEMLAEVFAVAGKRGLDPKLFIEIMTSTMFDGRVHKIYGDKMVNRSYAAGFAMPLVLKDVRLALAEAESAGAPMPSVNVVRDRLVTGIAQGHADLDWTALGLVAADAAGLAH